MPPAAPSPAPQAAKPPAPPVKPTVAAATLPAKGAETRRVDRRSFSARLIVVSFAGDLIVAAAMLMLAYWVRFVSPVSIWSKADEMVTLSSYTGQIMLPEAQLYSLQSVRL